MFLEQFKNKSKYFYVFIFQKLITYCNIKLYCWRLICLTIISGDPFCLDPLFFWIVVLIVLFLFIHDSIQWLLLFSMCIVLLVLGSLRYCCFKPKKYHIELIMIHFSGYLNDSLLLVAYHMWHMAAKFS